jgi:serine/threonine protein kinase/tetratricopeptide (TPR) repeat protein
VPDYLDRLTSALASRYRVERTLGSGGWATVYLATDLKHNRQVAVKVLRPELASAIGQDRFLREIEIAARVRHPHILPLYDSGDVEGTLYYVMPFVAGQSLRARLERERQLPLDEALRIAADVAEALSLAHQHGVVHRDIKPENIMLESGHAIVADFGIARALHAAGEQNVTSKGFVVGTPGYMSPEQATAGEEPVDARSDIYSLGCVLYEMLVGEPPFTGPNARAILARTMTEPHRPARSVRDTVPAALEEALGKMLAKVPADRFTTANDVTTVLRKLLAGETPGLKRAVSTSTLTRRVGLGIAVTVVLAALAWALLQLRHPEASNTPPVPVVVVPPFDNVSRSADDGIFAAGMTALLITEFSKLRGLDVIEGTPERLLPGDIEHAVVLRGSVTRGVDSVRIDVRLVDARTNRALWGDSYTRSMENVLALQSELALAVTNQVNAELTPSETRRLAVDRRGDGRAHELYLYGRGHWERRTAAGLRTAIQYFEQVRDLDPGNALAYTGLADAYVLVPQYGGANLTDAQAYERAQTFADSALMRDSTLGEVWTTRAHVRFLAHRDWLGAARDFDRALELSPGYATLRQWYGEYLRARGLVDSSLGQIQEASRRAPRNNVVRTALAAALWVARRYDASLATAREVLEVDPDFSNASLLVTLIHLQQSQFDSAGTAALQAGFPEPLVRPFVEALSERGSPGAASETVAQFERAGLDPFQAAAFYSILGDTSRALGALERAEQTNNPNLLIYLASAPIFDQLRTSARYSVLLERIGLSKAPSF